MSKRTQFSPDAASRIVNATKRVEQQPYAPDVQRYKNVGPQPQAPLIGINTTGEVIPAGAALQTNGGEAETTYRVNVIKPTEGSASNVVFALGEIAIDGRGPVVSSSTEDRRLRALVDNDTGADGASYGTQADSFTLATGNSGFVGLGASGGRAFVRPFFRQGELSVVIPNQRDGYRSDQDWVLYPARVEITHPTLDGSRVWTFEVDDICIITDEKPSIGQFNYDITGGARGVALSANNGSVDIRSGKTLTVSVGGGSFAEDMDHTIYPDELNDLYDAGGIPRIESGDAVTVADMDGWGLDYTRFWITIAAIGTGFVNLQISAPS